MGHTIVAQASLPALHANLYDPSILTYAKSMKTLEQFTMRPVRLESFSDAVLAIIITIMILDLHSPTDATLTALGTVTPTLLAYIISFSVIAIYWTNHHHLVQNVRQVSPAIMWANLFFLFWISLIPFFTGWMGEFHTYSLPAACYAVLLLMCSFAYGLLQRAIVTTGGNTELRQQLGKNVKGLVSRSLYVVAIPLAFITPWLAYALFLTVSILWLVPDRRLITRTLS